MKKLRCSLATLTLLATLAGSFFLQGMVSASMAHGASHHINIAFSHPPCGLANDC